MSEHTRTGWIDRNALKARHLALLLASSAVLAISITPRAQALDMDDDGYWPIKPVAGFAFMKGALKNVQPPLYTDGQKPSQRPVYEENKEAFYNSCMYGGYVRPISSGSGGIEISRVDEDTVRIQADMEEPCYEERYREVFFGIRFRRGNMQEFRPAKDENNNSLLGKVTYVPTPHEYGGSYKAEFIYPKTTCEQDPTLEIQASVGSVAISNFADYAAESAYRNKLLPKGSDIVYTNSVPQVRTIAYEKPRFLPIVDCAGNISRDK